MRLRTSLFLLLLATAIPLAAFSALVYALLLQRQYDNFVVAVKDRNRAFMSAVDAELNGHITALRALAALPSLDRGDLPRFYDQARAALGAQSAWVNVILLSRDGRQLVNAALPWGTKLLDKPAQPESLRPVVEQKRPAVGQLIPRGPYLDRSGIPVRVPVLRNGEVAYVLTGVLKPRAVRSGAKGVATSGSSSSEP